MAIPAGIIIGWPSTAGSIPAGWTRVADLDGKYLKCVSDALTDPGTTGGAATHVHTTPGHVHDTNHTHTVLSGSSSGTTLTDHTYFAAIVAPSHTHAVTTGTATINSGSTAPSTNTGGNDPTHHVEIWIESDGTPVDFPSGATAFFNGAPIPDDFTEGSADRFLKGAAAAGDGGGSSAGNTSHSHTVDAHTHTGTAHGAAHNVSFFHTAYSIHFGTAATTLCAWYGASHLCTVNSADTAALASASGGTSDTSSAVLPPYYKLSIVRSSAPVPIPTGTITVWRGLLADIPGGWSLCDGTNGTPNLLGKYVLGAANTGEQGDTGGSTGTHTHMGAVHTHTTSGHTHTASVGLANTSPQGDDGSSFSVSHKDHTHTASVASRTPTVGSVSTGTLSAATTEPPYYAVAFIQATAPPPFDATGDGGLVAAGVADLFTTPPTFVEGAGGLTAGGIADVETPTILHSHTGDDGPKIAGTADLLHTATTLVVGSGGPVFGGEADVLAIAAVFATGSGGIKVGSTTTTTATLPLDVPVHGSRRFAFRYELLDLNNTKLGDLADVTACSIDQNWLADIRRTAKFTLRDTGEIDFLSNRIKPWIQLRLPPYGPNDFVEWPQGVFLLSSPRRTVDDTGTRWREVDAYDATQVYTDDLVSDRYTVASGANYIDAVSTLLGSVPKNVTPSASTLPTAREWEPGTSKLKIINELLGAINYEALSFDENGMATARPYRVPAERPAEYDYADDELSVMLPEVAQDLDLFAVANEWVLVVSAPDRPALVSTYTNDNPTSPTSTVRRGRTIVDFRTDQDVADQAALDARVSRLAFEASQVFEAVEFETGLMPIHSGNDVYDIHFSTLSVSAKYSEHTWSMTLAVNATMKHRARRVVTV